MLKRLLLVFLMLLLPYLVNAKDHQLTIGFGEAYRPFAWNDHGVAAGIQADFVEEILINQLGFSVKLLSCPWRRCQQLVKSGKIDGFFTVPTAERESYTTKTVIPFYYTNFVMHTAKSNSNLAQFMAVKNLEDIKSIPNIMHVNMLGSGWHKQELGTAVRRTEVSDAFIIPKMLVLNRADLYIEQAEMFKYQANSLGLLDEIITLQHPILYKMPWHLFIHKQSSHVTKIEIINRHLKELQANGELEKIKIKIFSRHGV